MAENRKTVIERLSDFACGLRFDDLPAEVVQKANDCFFDFAGCYYGAIKRDGLPGIAAGIASENPKDESGIWGTGLRCGTAEAALAMGTVGYHLEFDDGISVSGHWGSASIPATFLSVAKSGGNGRDLITAIVAAYEVGSRISRMFSPRLLKKHIHFPCMMGAFGAAAGYAKGQKLSPEVLSGALSLAGLFPVGTYSTATGGASGKGLYSGWPNFLGINAVRLSALGLRGDADVMEAPDGFARAVGLAPMEEKYLEEAQRDLGKSFHIMLAYFKPYPCCRWLHAPVHALLGLMREHGVGRDDIQSVDIGGPEFAMMYDTRTGYESKVTCQYSIPYSVGAAAYYGKLGIEEFEESARMDAGLREFIGRISMRVDDELQAKFPEVFGVVLTLTLKDGRTFRVQQGTPWGPDKPATKDELVAKFKSLTDGVLSIEEQAEWERLYRSGFESGGAFERVLELTGRKV